MSGSAESYAYDGDGVRFSRTVGTDPAIRYVSDVNAGLPVTIADGTRKYVWGLGLAYAVDEPFGFTGEPADTTGLSYLRARYYAP